jgi:hypothetical protein
VQLDQGLNRHATGVLHCGVAATAFFLPQAFELGDRSGKLIERSGSLLTIIPGGTRLQLHFLPQGRQGGKERKQVWAHAVRL